MTFIARALENLVTGNTFAQWDLITDPKKREEIVVTAVAAGCIAGLVSILFTRSDLKQLGVASVVSLVSFAANVERGSSLIEQGFSFFSRFFSDRV